MPRNPFHPGAVIADRYVVERELAAGGVGVVVLAKHIELGHTVAIKYLQPQRLDDETLVERFKLEAKLAASLRSEHVVRIHDVGTVDGDLPIPYMVMEYLEGEDLGSAMRLGPPPIETAIDWVLQACRALDEAHERGIVHRDIKPDNLFLVHRHGAAPIVKVVDFGISKAGLVASGHRMRHRTGVQACFGTPLYMPPEQLRSSASVDARSDIWALGVVLYELLTGQMPFEIGDIRLLLDGRLRAPTVSLRARRPSIPEPLERIVLSCLSLEREHRPQSVGDLMLLLTPFAETMRAVATSGTYPVAGMVISVGAVTELAPNATLFERPAAPRDRGRVLFGLAGALVVLLAAGGGAVRLALDARSARPALRAEARTAKVESARTLDVQAIPALRARSTVIATQPQPVVAKPKARPKTGYGEFGWRL